MEAARRMETGLIGLVGGLGPAATVHYYAGLLATCRRRGVSPRLMINQAAVELVLDAVGRGDRSALADHLAARMDELRRAGTSLLAISAVAPHLCMPELVRRMPGERIIDIVAVTAEELGRRGMTRVALMGPRATVASRLFGRLETVAVDPTPAQIDRVHDLYVTIVRRARVDDDVAIALRKLAADYLDQLDVEAIVLAGTELALVPPQTWDGMTVVDCAALHIEAIVAAAIAERA
jgi:aspartate racemase